MSNLHRGVGWVGETVGADTANSRGTSVVSGAANTKGSYVELIAATGNDAKMLSIQLCVGQGSTSGIYDVLCDIAVGASGSEQIVASNLYASRGNAFNITSYFFPVGIPSGTRISARIQSTTATTTILILCFLGAGGFDCPEPANEIYTYGANTADSGGVGVDPGGTADTKGAWSEITPSSDSLSGLIVALGNQANAARTAAGWLVDIGIGAAGSEQVIIENLPATAGAVSDLVIPSSFPFLPISIPAGTRIAARAQCSITDATDRLIDVVVCGVA